jgi:microcystin-dependent protein
MAQPYVGEIRIFAGNFAPAGWMFCSGAVLPISEYDVLFNLIGTTYGGDGQSTFNLPDLRGRIPVHQGEGFSVSQTGGAEQVTLNVQQLPRHSHSALASGDIANAPTPTSDVLGKSSQVSTFIAGTTNPSQRMNSRSIMPAGSTLPHTNFQPYLCVNFIISLFGIYPSPS